MEKQTKLENIEKPGTTPFGAPTFNGEDTKRKCIESVITETQEEQINEFYNGVLDYLTNHSDRFFKKRITVDTLKDFLKHQIAKKDNIKLELNVNSTLLGIML